MSVAVCTASPSLALLKYWGKHDVERNIPATPSLAVSLGGLGTTTRVRPVETAEDEVYVDGTLQPRERYAGFFVALRSQVGSRARFRAESHNDFPTSAGLASSSSGFAALAHACARAVGAAPSLATLSSVARVGSASAARAVFGGFTLLPARARSAKQLFGADYWPDLRILVVIVTSSRKSISSRDAMESTRSSSPYYRSWLRSASKSLPGALEALRRKDIEQLGAAARLSYLRMFATIVSTDPPVLYWLPRSVAVIEECAAMRKEGIGVWETMDAGPQVKLLCLASEAPRIRQRIESLGGDISVLPASVGPDPVVRVEGD